MTSTVDVRRAGSPHTAHWIVLALLIPAALLGFANSYFRGLTFSGMTVTGLVHVHAALITLWLLMLVGQAWFIRARRYTWHRWVVGGFFEKLKAVNSEVIPQVG